MQIFPQQNAKKTSATPSQAGQRTNKKMIYSLNQPPAHAGNWFGIHNPFYFFVHKKVYNGILGWLGILDIHLGQMDGWSVTTTRSTSLWLWLGASSPKNISRTQFARLNEWCII